MKTKFTLYIDENIIEEAKLYAKNNRLSLSKLIENYLTSLTQNKIHESPISTLVESITGVISETNNYKKEYADYLSKKHS